MTEAWLALLQFADGLFPSGGFAHSFGLETYAQDGVVRDRTGLEAMKAVPEARAASRQMGRQTLRVAAALGDDAFLAELARTVDDGLTPGHHAAVVGAALGRAGAGPEAVAAAYLHSTAALLVGAGLLLIALGQLDGQRVLAALRPRIARLASAAATATAADMWSFNPGLELAGIRHATLDARLFRS